MKKIIALAPMDWITNNAYRLLCNEIWNNQKNTLNINYNFFRFTEFMTSEWYVRNPRKVCRHLLTNNWSEHTIAQIYWWNHETLLQTAIDIDEKYSDSFHGIELNIGCPSPKIMSCEAGSGMLKDRPKTLQIIDSMSKHIQKPFSIKTRSWLDFSDTKEQFDFIIEAAYHCQMITIHGRNYKQSHSWEVNREFIQSVKDELIKRNMGNVIIIWNGWLKSADDWLQYLNKWWIDGIMLGQAAMCNPWSLTNYKPSTTELREISFKHLYLNLANERYFNQESIYDYHNNTLTQPNPEQLETIILWIQNWSITQEKWFSLIEFRKHLFRYVNGLTGNNEFKRKVACVHDYQSLKNEIELFFNSLS